MPHTNSYTANQIDKLGNAIIFLCGKLKGFSPVSKTHILKLVFILDEFAIRQWGIPFFGMNYKVWKLGPVSPDLFYELSDVPNLLAPFIRVENFEGKTEVVPMKEFSDDEFSDRELELLEKVGERFKTCTAGDLINFTHRENTPWFLTAQKHGLVEQLNSGQINTTDIDVEFESIIAEDEARLSLYHAHQEYLRQIQHLKS